MTGALHTGDCQQSPPSNASNVTNESPRSAGEPGGRQRGRLEEQGGDDCGAVVVAKSKFARFVTEPSQPSDGPPEWPKGADWRIVGIACPECGHESRDPVHRNAGSFLRWVTCGACGWRGRVPL